MNDIAKTAVALLLGLTLGISPARSQSVFGESVTSGTLADTIPGFSEVVPDTVRITPSMVDSIIASRELQEFGPDIESNVFVPKGQWITGVSVSYSQSAQNDYQFLVIEGLNADTYTVKVAPMLMYAVKNDMAVGVKFAYSRSLGKLEHGEFVFGSDNTYELDHIYSLSHNYYGTALFRNYFSLGSSRRFGFFSQLQLELGGGQSKITKGVAEDLTGTYERNFSLNVGLTPGMMMFLSNWSAIEVNVGVLGFSYHVTHSVRDRIYPARRHSKSANFKINLFSITFGTTFYI